MSRVLQRSAIAPISTVKLTGMLPNGRNAKRFCTSGRVNFLSFYCRQEP